MKLRIAALLCLPACHQAGAAPHDPLSPAQLAPYFSGGPAADALRRLRAGDHKAAAAYFFPDEAKLAEHAAPQGFESMGDGYRVTVKPAPGAPSRPSRLRGVLVVEGGERPKAVQVDVPVATGDPAPAPAMGPRRCASFRA